MTFPVEQNPEPGEDAARHRQDAARPEGAQSVYRAIALLRGVAQRNEAGVQAGELATALGLTLATAHRLLKVLTWEGLLTFDPYSKRYHLGLELFTLGLSAHQFAVRDLLRPVLQRLARLSGGTAFLVVRAGADAVCLERVDGAMPVPNLTVVVGSRRPLGVGAGSLALLAALRPEVCERILRHNDPYYPDYGGVTTDDIRAAVVQARRTGFAVNDGRIRPGVRAAGAAVGPGFGNDGALAGVSIAADSAHLSDPRLAELAKLIRSETDRVDWSDALAPARDLAQPPSSTLGRTKT